jgi:hypothetical protein
VEGGHDMRRPDGCTCGNAQGAGHMFGCPVETFDMHEAEAPPPVDPEDGAVSASADHSSTDPQAEPAGISPIDTTVEAAAAAVPFYRDLAMAGLIEHIADLHRELGDIPGSECPFVRAAVRNWPVRTIGDYLRVGS